MSQFKEHHRKFHTLHRHSNHPIHKIGHHLHKLHHHSKNTIHFSSLWLSILVIFLTIFFIKLVPHWQEKAQSNNGLICTPDGGMVNKLNSDRLNLINWKNQPVTIWIQYNLCPFSGQLPYEGYQCNQYNNHITDILQAGETKTYSIYIPNCQIGQLDINTVNPTDGGCYTPENNLWSGGQAFAIKANTNCDSTNENPPNTTNPPTPTPSPTPTPTPSPTPTLTPTPTPSPTPMPSPTPYIEVFFRTPRNIPAEKNVCVSSWITDQSGVFLNSNDTDCTNRTWFSSPLQSNVNGYAGIYVDESNDINTLYFSPKADSIISQHYPNGGLHYGWPRWSTGGRTITLIVNPTPTQTPTPIPTYGSSPTPRPTSSITIKISPTPDKDYYYHTYGNTVTNESTLKPPIKIPPKTPTLTPTKVPSKLDIKKYWPAAVVGIPIALMIIRLIL